MGEPVQIAERTLGTGLLTAVGGSALRWALVPLAAGVLVPAGMVATGTVGAASIAAVLADPLSVLSARSPGSRPAGALTQSKARKAAPAAAPDLATLLTRPVPGGAPATAGDIVPGADEGIPAADIIPAVTDVAATPADIAPFFPIAGGLYPGGSVVATPGESGGGGGGGGGGTPPTTGVTPTPETPVASVPEPSTWLSLLVGFGAIGTVLRRRRRPVSAWLLRG